MNKTDSLVSSIEAYGRVSQVPIPADLLPDRLLHARELHRVAQDFDDDAVLLESQHGHTHVITQLHETALEWRRAADSGRE